MAGTEMSANARGPGWRPLKIYAFDPTRGRKLGNYTTVKVRNEPVEPGPIGEYLAVIDYDASNKKYYQPVDLNSPEVMLGGGLDPSESDPRFHQQMVYAVIMDTIRRFEFALGRKIKWARDTGPKSDPYHGKLRVFPHGMQDANAFYDPGLRALMFGYFAASTREAGANLPGQTVFTCLSHDIVAHETTHALIDGLRAKFTSSTSHDTMAFHEAFADIVALFQHFSYKESLLDAINRTGGYIHRARLGADAPSVGEAVIRGELTADNPLVELAKQFGEALGTHAALRAALGTKADPKELETTLEPHDRGSILVAAVFDAFFSMYLKRTRDLMRIGRAGGAVSAEGDLHPDLANRLAGEAAKLAERFFTICVRSLDYCPPVDITFGEFLRAIITADSDLVPDDPWGYRLAFIEAFRARGIVPQDVVSYSEEALRWCPPEEYDPNLKIEPCAGLVLNVFAEPRAGTERRNAALLHRWAEKYRKPLGLSEEGTFQVFSFHPLHRVGPDGRVTFDFVVEFLEQRQASLDPDNPKSPSFLFYGGSTVILDARGQIRYAILKRIDNDQRLEQQRQFQQRGLALAAEAPYERGGRIADVTFRAVHRGY
jgi:hypothetical protein